MRSHALPLLLLLATTCAASACSQTPPDTAAVPAQGPRLPRDDGTFVRFADGDVWRRVDHGRDSPGPDSPSGSAVASRIESLDGGSLREPVFWYGGRFQFMDICPEWGCLAVQFGTDGEVEHAWPLQPDLLEQAANDAEAEYDVTPGFSFARDAMPMGILRYPNGDLLVVFRNRNARFFANTGAAFEPAAGAVRIDRRGHPVWFRRDLSHHWPHMENDGSVLVLARSYGDGPIRVPRNDGGGQHLELQCRSRRPQLDSLNVIDGDGRLLDSVDLTDAMQDSPLFPPVLLGVPSTPCNLLHPNFVHRVGGDVQDVQGLSSGDLVVSMRNVNAFAILDAGSGRVKRLVRGSFRRQHAVHHWRGSRFLLFDNQGDDGRNGPARLLMVDVADGRETTIFPNAGTPEALRGLRSSIMGKISISPDRRRALVVFSMAGVAVEVRLSDGAALKVFRSLHDVSGLEQFPEERANRPAIFRMTGLDYVHAP